MKKGPRRFVLEYFNLVGPGELKIWCIADRQDIGIEKHLVHTKSILERAKSKLKKHKQ